MANTLVQLSVDGASALATSLQSAEHVFLPDQQHLLLRGSPLGMNHLNIWKTKARRTAEPKFEGSYFWLISRTKGW